MTSIAQIATAGKVKRAAIYPRVSTGTQEQNGTSLESQEERCRAYVAEHGYTLDEAHIYREIHTGTELWERPQLTRLREAVRLRQVDVVVVFAIDRLARDPVHLGVIITEADHAGVDVAFVTEPLDNTPEGQLIRFVRGYAAKIEHEKIRERTTRGKRSRAQAGKVHSSGTELFGYRRDKARGVRCVYAPEADIVRQIFTWIAAEGYSVRGVARELDRREIPPPSTGKRRYKDPTRRPSWGKAQIAHMLTHPAYRGEGIAWRHLGPNRKRPESEWIRLPPETTPAIVSPELWDEAHARMATNRGDRTRNESRPSLLRGHVACAVCERPMYYEVSTQGTAYRCSSRGSTAGPCGGKGVSSRILDAWAWDRLADVVRNPDLIRDQVERAKANGPDVNLVAERESLERSYAKIERQQERLMRRFREHEDDGFPWELVEREITVTEKEKKQLQASIDKIAAMLAAQQARVDQLDSLNEYCSRVATHLDEFGLEEKRLTLSAFGVVVKVNGRPWSIRGEAPIGNGSGVLDITH